MKTLLTLLVMAGLLSGAAVAGEKHWEKARIVSHSLQRMVGPHGGRPETLDVVIIDLGDQTYTLGRVTGWSGNHTKMADLPSDYVQAYRPWGPVPLSRATKDPNLLPPVMFGVPGLLFVNGSYSMTVLDSRGKQVRYEVMAIGGPEEPKAEAPLPPGNRAKASETPTVAASTPAAQVWASSTPLGATFANSMEGGVEIKGFLPNSPIQVAGLHVGDVIKAVDLKPVKTAEDFRDAVAAREPGANVRISYVLLHSNQWWVQKEVNVSLPK